jgi:nicotinamide riboside transporter PnuC
MDVVFLPLFEIKGIPAFSIIGAAFALLVLTSVLNWIFKKAWEQRREHETTDR